MLSKFFKRRPQQGKPIALPGLADGLAKMDHAWATLNVYEGYVDWSHGTPTIMIDTGSSSGDVHRTRIEDDNDDGTPDRVGVYVPDGDNGTVAGMSYVNGEALTDYGGDLTEEVGEKWWYLDAALPGVGTSKYVYWYLDTQSAPGTVDLTSPQALQFNIELAATLSKDPWQKLRIIAKITNDAGAYTIEQYGTGPIVVNARFTDSESAIEVTAAGGTPLFNCQSIETQSADGQHSLTIFGFDTASPAITQTSLDNDTYHILSREVVGGVAKVVYMSGAQLKSVVVDEVSDSILPIDHNNDTTGKQGGNGTDEFYHLTADERTAIGDAIDASDPDAIDHGSLGGLNDDDHDNATNGYLMLGGTATRNRMGGVISNSAGAKIFDPNATGLFDSAEIGSVDFGSARTLYDASVQASVAWGARQLIKSDGATVAYDWENDTFGDGFSAAIIDIVEHYT